MTRYVDTDSTNEHDLTKVFIMKLRIRFLDVRIAKRSETKSHVRNSGALAHHYPSIISASNVAAKPPQPPSFLVSFSLTDIVSSTLSLAQIRNHG